MKKIMIIPWIPSCCFLFFEKLLTKMRKNGWNLYYYWGPFYFFHKTKASQNGSYFVHSLHTGTKESSYFSFELRHPFYIEKLGNKSIINSLARKRFLTIIQLKSEVDLGVLRDLRIERQSLQFWHLVKESAVWVVILLIVELLLWVKSISFPHWILYFFLLLTVVYLLFSAIVTKHIIRSL